MVDGRIRDLEELRELTYPVSPSANPDHGAVPAHAWNPRSLPETWRPPLHTASPTSVRSTRPFPLGGKAARASYTRGIF